MSKDVHTKMDDRLAEAIQRYATGHGIGFGAALSLLAARSLRDEGIFIDQDDQPEQEIRR